MDCKVNEGGREGNRMRIRGACDDEVCEQRRKKGDGESYVWQSQMGEGGGKGRNVAVLAQI